LLGSPANRLPQFWSSSRANEENAVVFVYQENKRRPAIDPDRRVEVEIVITIKQEIGIFYWSADISGSPTLDWWTYNPRDINLGS
jgi:hypothetical protein